MDHQKYVFRRGREAARRLRLLARLKWPTTRWLLARAGLRPGMRVLDVGCGIGMVTLRIAKVVGPAGLAVGVDADPAFIEHARRRAAKRAVPAQFHAAQAERLGELDEFDFVFSRFLLTHLPSPERAIAEMVRVLRPGGTLAVEDIDFAGHFCHPACPAFESYVRLYQAAVSQQGADPNIGPKLPGMLLDAGLEDVEVEVVQPTFRTGQAKTYTALTMEHIRHSVVEANLASDAEVDAVVADLRKFGADPRTIMSMSRVVQTWGKKPT